MDFPKGYKGPGSQIADHKMKKNMLKRLKKTMDKASASKVANKDNIQGKGVSSVNPSYPGFKDNC